ncbi:MAG: type I-C CRISPR-associated protein Cas8c/Csd1 [Clostridiales Family XIII bacterium]|jgi:CRISPR-associated protein Csd1|nr:type I-C CRISPR-associated protein Cas8c/Csd1 [Clostridiales Family XIII bacterium]
MIINDLSEYYDILSASSEDEISKFGYETVAADYEIVLDESGDLLSINNFVDLEGKSIKKEFQMPIRMKKSGIAASPVCDNFNYILGVGINSKNGAKVQDTTDKKFLVAKDLHSRLFKNAVSNEAKAIVSFFETWEVENAWSNGIVAASFNEKNKFTGTIVFRLDGEKQYFHEIPEIVSIWEEENKKNNKETSQVLGQCAITGAIDSPIALLHPQLFGVKGAQATGAALVCFNKDSDLSYGFKQSMNAQVSEDIAFKYTTVLNKLIKSQDNRLYIGDDTLVFWASTDNNAYVNIFKGLFDLPDENDKEKRVDRVTEEHIKTILGNGIEGVPINSEFNPNTNFHILGISPNAGRISIRFYYKDTFKLIVDRIKQHYDDIKIDGKWKNIKAYWLLDATKSSKSSEKINPLLGGALIQSIIFGKMYPQVIFNNVIRLSKVDGVSQARASLIKGYINRKNRMLKEEKENINMTLNEQSTNEAYVLGRTFAILEKAQKDSQGGDVNATIKDKYFAAASSNPSLAFPNLIKLAQHHFAKLGKDGNTYLERLFGDVLTAFGSDSFPNSLNLEEQGRFIIGYYQQNKSLYTKKEKKEEA